MDDNLTEKIRAFLADPQAAERIAAIAGTLGISQSQPDSAASTASQASPASTVQPAFVPQQRSAPGGFQPKDPRLDLLHALRPLVAVEKRGRLDDLLRIATVASLFGNLKK